MKLRRRLLTPLVLFGFCLTSYPARSLAQWVQDGIPISGYGDRTFLVSVLKDGSGGAYVGFRGDYPQLLNLARVNGSGEKLWSEQGYFSTVVEMTTTPGPDGGAQMITLQGSYQVWLQRFRADGSRVWPLLGQLACQMPAQCLGMSALYLDTGETVIAWSDRRDPAYAQVFAQRLDVDGNPLWGPNGKQLVSAYDYDIVGAGLLPADNGGFIVIWTQYPYRSDIGSRSARKFDSAGNLVWGRGLPSGALISDGASGLISGWASEQYPNWRIQVSRMDSNGASLWGPRDVVVVPEAARAADWDYYPSLVPDGLNGVIVIWQDARNGDQDAYAQRVDAGGTALWTNNGVVVASGAGGQYPGGSTSDGAGGAVVSFVNYPPLDLYAQRIGPDGALRWDPSGAPVCTAAGNEQTTRVALDGNGGVLLAWNDTRVNPASSNITVYAQRLNLDTGEWGSNPVAVAISSFDASATRAGVRLQAQFRSDLGVTAVNVYRRASGEPLSLIAQTAGSEEERFHYLDRNVVPGVTYDYQISVMDADGEFFSPFETVTIPGREFSLEQNRPNPFNPETTIRFETRSHTRAVLDVFAADGRHVRTLTDGVIPAGSHEVIWDGRDASGKAVGSGVYFYRLAAGKDTATRKMVLLK